MSKSKHCNRKKSVSYDYPIWSHPAQKWGTYQYRTDTCADSEIGDRQIITGREFPAVEKSVEHLEWSLQPS